MISHILKRRFTRREILANGLGVIGALTAGFFVQGRIEQSVQFFQSILAKKSFADSDLVQGFLHPLSTSCDAENILVHITAERGKYNINEAGDSTGAGWFITQGIKSGFAPASLYYGRGVQQIFKTLTYPDGGCVCNISNVAVNKTTLSDLPHQFSQLNFAAPSTLIISDGGNPLLAWSIKNEAFLRSLVPEFRLIEMATSEQIASLEKKLKYLRGSLDAQCLQLQSHYEFALGDLIGKVAGGALLDNIVIISLPPVWLADSLPLSADIHSKKSFPMRGNPVGEIFAKYLIITGNNAIKAAINNALAFLRNPELKDFHLGIRYQDITQGVIKVGQMNGIHPTPEGHWNIAFELWKHTFLDSAPLASLPFPQFQ